MLLPTLGSLQKDGAVDSDDDRTAGDPDSGVNHLCRLQKVFKATLANAEKVMKSMPRSDSLSLKAKAEVAELERYLMEVTNKHDECQFILKFKKSKENEKLSDPELKLMAKEAYKSLQNLNDQCKMVKAVTASKREPAT